MQQDRKWLQVGWRGLVVLAACLLLFISIWRAIDSGVEQALVPVSDPGAVWEGKALPIPTGLTTALPKSKYLPHHPLYLLLMVKERMVLWLTGTPEVKAELLRRYAHERMGVALQLTAQRRGEEAIEAAAKGYMYALAAGDEMQQTGVNAKVWSQFHEDLMIYEQVLILLKESVSDNIKPKIGEMVKGLVRLDQQAIDRMGGEATAKTEEEKAEETKGFL